jgi:hypothetical protein
VIHSISAHCESRVCALQFSISVTNSTPSQDCQMVCFQTKIPIWEGLRLEIVDTFYGHLEYFTDIWDILWPFGTFCVCSVHFFQIWYHVPRKIWQPRTGCIWSAINFYDRHINLYLLQQHCARVTRLGEISPFGKKYDLRIQLWIKFRVARWFIFKPKISILLKFGGPLIGKCWYILWPFGIF